MVICFAGVLSLKEMEMNKTSKGLVPLKPLDLKKCKTLGEIVDAMGCCAFGARMLGEVAATIQKWVENRKRIIFVYDGKKNTPLSQLIEEMAGTWGNEMITPEELCAKKSRDRKSNLIVVGPFSERCEDAIFDWPRQVIYINQFGQTNPDNIREGYYPNGVFADPRFVLPILYYTLRERLDDCPASIGHFMWELQKFDGLAYEVAGAAETLRQMISDPDCYVFLTLSGAMTIAKMGLVICDMIEMGYVQCIASTGALMAHGFVEGIGLKHYKYNPAIKDAELVKRRLNRVTDTLEPEDNLDEAERIFSLILSECKSDSAIAPSFINREIGRYLEEHYSKERAILLSAYRRNVPVLVPAFHDSELGNDLLVHNIWQELKRGPSITVNQELDSRLLMDLVEKAKKVGIFSIGGGVPRNYVQNVIPLLDVLYHRMGDNYKHPDPKKFSYACRVCPDPPHYGHLSGCTYSEGVSWGKMDPAGKFAEVHADATLIWPLLVRYVMENS